MDYFAAFQVSATGMAIEKLRMDVTAINLANMRVSQAPGDAPIQALRVLGRPVAVDFSAQLQIALGRVVGGAPVPTIAGVPTKAQLVHEPGHPHADAKGNVSYPGINHGEEMMTMLSAMRAYEANVVALGAARNMAARALDIGGSQ